MLQLVGRGRHCAASRRVPAEGAAAQVGIAAVGLLLVQVATGLLPDVTVLGYLTTTRLILAVGLAAVGVRWATGGRSGAAPGGRAAPGALTRVLLGCAVLLVGWQLLGAVVLGTGLPAARLALEDALVAVLVVGAVRDADDLRAVLVLVAAVVAAVSVRALVQFTDGENTMHFLLPEGLSAAGGHAEQMPPGAIVRVVGYFDDPNVLAAFLVLLAPFVPAAVRPLSASPAVRGLLLALPAAALVLTFGRSALVGLLVGSGVVVARRIGAVRALAVLAAASAVVVLSPVSVGRLGSAVLPRLAAWSEAARLAAAEPLFGIGLDRYPEVVRGFWHAHNLPLHLAAEAGAVAGVLVAVVVGVAVVQAVRVPGGSAAGDAAVVALVGFAVACMLDNPYNARAVSTTFWLVLGLSVAVAELAGGAPRAGGSAGDPGTTAPAVRGPSSRVGVRA